MSEGEFDAVVVAKQLTRRYKTVEAVKGIDLEIKRGEVFGLIGPDGAGKTTIFHMLGGILDQSSGELSVLGTTASAARLQIGYLTQNFSLYPDLSIKENIRYTGGLRSVTKDEFEERSNHYLKLMDLAQFQNRLAGNLSGGMKQKLALCCALIARPQLLLLDEPTTGVDPVSRRDFWDVLSTIAAEGVTVAVATPYLDEAERCTRIALIHQGTIERLGSPQELKEGLQLHRLELRGASMEAMDRLVAAVAKDNPDLIRDRQEFGDRMDVLVPDCATAQKSIEEKENEIAKVSISTQEPTLENVFALLLREKEQAGDASIFPFTRESSRHSEAGETAALSAPDIAIQAKQLNKNFGSFRAAKNVNISIEYGQIYGLLGANGAGKTTTIKMLCGLLEPTSGSVVLAGQARDLRNRKLRQKIGYMSQKFTLYQDLSVAENLAFYAGVYGVEKSLQKQRIEWVLKTCGLAGSEAMLAGHLPGGFRQRLAFGTTVLHEPSILFLDEPTSGVDPLARRELWTLINAFARHGTAILVTTHFLEEAEHCQNLGFMVAGEVVASGSPEQIKAAQPGKLLEVRTSDNPLACQLLREELEGWQVSVFADCLHVVVDDDEHGGKLLAKLNNESVKIETTRNIPFSLEDAFIGIVQRKKTDQAA